MKALLAVPVLLFFLSCNAKQVAVSTNTTDALPKKEIAIAAKKEPCDAQPENLHNLSMEEISRVGESLAKEKLVLSKTKRNIPAQVQCILDRIGGGHFTIGDPGQSWQCCCDRSDTSLPEYGLIAIAQSERYFLITYNTGGIAVRSHLLVIHHQDDRSADYWEQDAYGKDLSTTEGMLQALATR